jgi:hypothetical protein
MTEVNNTAQDDSAAKKGNADDSSLWNTSADDKGTDGASTEDKNLTPEQLVQKERSRHGREISSLKDQVSDLKRSIESLASDLTSRQTHSLPVEDDEKPPVEFVTTPDELEKYNAWKERKVAKQRENYTRDYVRAVKSLSYMNPEFHNEIEKELLASDTRYNSHSGFIKPSYDAEANYNIAEAKILKRKLKEAKGEVTVTRGDNSLATGVTVTSTNATTGKKKVELDEDAKKFLRGMGEKEDAEWVQDSVSRSDM